MINVHSGRKHFWPKLLPAVLSGKSQQIPKGINFFIIVFDEHLYHASWGIALLSAGNFCYWWKVFFHFFMHLTYLMKGKKSDNASWLREKCEKKVGGERWGNKSGFSKRIYLEIQSRLSMQCIQGIMSLCHHLSSTRPQGNEIRLHTPTCQSDPAMDGSKARECRLQPYEDMKTSGQLRKVSSLNGQDKRAVVWAKLALFLPFRSPHMSSPNFGADDQVSSIVLLWNNSTKYFKVLLGFC